MTVYVIEKSDGDGIIAIAATFAAAQRITDAWCVARGTHYGEWHLHPDGGASRHSQNASVYIDLWDVQQ